MGKEQENESVRSDDIRAKYDSLRPFVLLNHQDDQSRNGVGIHNQKVLRNMQISSS